MVFSSVPKAEGFGLSEFIFKRLMVLWGSYDKAESEVGWDKDNRSGFGCWCEIRD